ncbi:MAG: DUF502 domain-containing protein [Bacteroidetes bacterium]|nr:DUF502 domain-containing protein [Bacteroidota bacterium]MBL6944322.1 DUF502 domain-containing protein [Bacteroidales bacterium]
MKKGLTKRLVNYFLKGLLLLAPITITLWAIIELFNLIDGLLKNLIVSVIGKEIPGLGFVVLLLLISAIGYLGSTIIFNPIVTYFDKLMVKAPLIKIIYTSVKDLVSAFVGQKKRFTEPVLVKISQDSNLEKIGFITNKDLSIIGLPNEKVAVYLPHSYAWSGNLFIVSTEHITKIVASPTEVMKFVISAGVTNIE